MLISDVLVAQKSIFEFSQPNPNIAKRWEYDGVGKNGSFVNTRQGCLEMEGEYDQKWAGCRVDEACCLVFMLLLFLFFSINKKIISSSAQNTHDRAHEAQE